MVNIDILNLSFFLNHYCFFNNSLQGKKKVAGLDQFFSGMLKMFALLTLQAFPIYKKLCVFFRFPVVSESGLKGSGWIYDKHCSNPVIEYYLC